MEGTRIDRFRPPHCPWRECTDHRPSRRYRCSRTGSYRRQADPRRRVPRFSCPTCGRSFSLQSFACTYYMKRPELLLPVAAGLVAGSAHRQIARTLDCSPSTVTRLAARIGRHALLLQALALEHLRDLDEPVVLDHFETFVFSQEDRLGIATPVGQKSWFSYGLDPAPHRQGGKRSARKRALRRPLPAKEPGSVVRSTRRVLELLSGLSRAIAAAGSRRLWAGISHTRWSRRSEGQSLRPIPTTRPIMRMTTDSTDLNQQQATHHLAHHLVEAAYRP